LLFRTDDADLSVSNLAALGERAEMIAAVSADRALTGRRQPVKAAAAKRWRGTRQP
jgi:hypothetical protein